VSWLYYKMDHDYIWLPDGAEAPIQLKQMIACLKRMLTAFWSPFRSLVVKFLLKGHHFDAKYFTSTILSVIAENRQMQAWEDQNRKMALHFGPASPQTARSTIGYMNRNRLVQAPHMPFSLDLAPSDRYLFGKVKTALMGAHSGTKANFSGCHRCAPSDSPRRTRSSFDKWRVRLDACIQRAGDYIE
jgi:hypothetical protein